MAKIDEAELELLGNLFKFIQSKYGSKSISDIEDKFGTSARELTNIGEISEESLVQFCKEEGLTVPKKVSSKSIKKSSSSYGTRYSDGCGGGGSVRSGC